MSETRIEEDTQRTVVRRVESCEEVAIPESMVVCYRCKGKGSMSQYDEGYRSPTHSPKAVAQIACFVRDGLGYIKPRPLR
jgi:hypothetical protein